MPNPQRMPLPASAWPVAAVGSVWRVAIMGSCGVVEWKRVIACYPQRARHRKQSLG
jgi:hypothetical protein